MGPSSTDEFVFRHRICHCEGDDESPLITPCHCTGSLHFVHQACLQQWIKSSDTRCCELCKYEFIMETKLKPLRKVRKKGRSGRVLLSGYPGPPVVTAFKIGGWSSCCRSLFLVVISEVRPSFIGFSSFALRLFSCPSSLPWPSAILWQLAPCLPSYVLTVCFVSLARTHTPQHSTQFSTVLVFCIFLLGICWMKGFVDEEVP